MQPVRTVVRAEQGVTLTRIDVATSRAPVTSSWELATQRTRQRLVFRSADEAETAFREEVERSVSIPHSKPGSP